MSHGHRPTIFRPFVGAYTRKQTHTRTRTQFESLSRADVAVYNRLTDVGRLAGGQRPGLAMGMPGGGSKEMGVTPT